MDWTTVTQAGIILAAIIASGKFLLEAILAWRGQRDRAADEVREALQASQVAEIARKIGEVQSVLTDIATGTQKLIEMHSRTGPNGVPAWYVREELYGRVAKIEECLEQLANDIKELKRQKRIEQ